ncbi:MAG TPA: hypothetical protein VJY42_01075 [Candidatus Methanomethylophilaceae archaeon]|nr:hypothetical protein [Candidatus Methanomethylophilaceae archaeon]
MKMSECKVTINAGACKRKTIVNAVGDDMGVVTITLDTDCEYLQKMALHLEPITSYMEVEAPICTTVTYKLANEHLPHAACPVPCGIIKAIEVAGDLGLKRDVSMKIE